LALIYSDADRMEEAVELLEHAARRSPDHEIINTGLAKAYLRVGRGEDAYRIFLLVRRLYPANRRARLGLAVLHAAAEQMDQAGSFLEEGLEIGGREARAEAETYPVLEPLLQ